MTPEDFHNHAKTNLERAGITGTKLADIMALVAVIAQQNHAGTPLHETVDTFAKVAKFENLPSVAARKAAASPEVLSAMKSGLPAWQRYFLDCFKRDEFCDLPPEMLSQSSMWRCGTYESLLEDTIMHNGTIMATLLSMAFKPKVVVEMGIDGGITTMQLCRLNPQARVYGVDKFSRKRGAMVPIATMALMQNVNNLTIHIGDSWEFDMSKQVDLCFIDGEHCGDGPMKDTRRAWENRNSFGDWCIAWDDYHPNNPDVKAAVDQFVAEKGLTLNHIGSWVWVGTKTSAEVEAFQ